jgi:hypothetical protein
MCYNRELTYTYTAVCVCVVDIGDRGMVEVSWSRLHPLDTTNTNLSLKQTELHAEFCMPPHK